MGYDDGEESFSRIAPVLHLLFKHGNIRTHLLARYEAPEEDRNHLLQCPGPRATHQFKKSISAVPELLKSLETSPALSEAIMTILKRYRAKQTINPQAFHVTDGRAS